MGATRDVVAPLPLRQAAPATSPWRGRIALVLLAILATPAAARKPPPELVLDAAAPIIEAEIDGQPFRLRVDLSQSGVIELNPDAANRLDLAWTAGHHLQIGRTMLFGRTAEAVLTFAGVKRPLLLSEHGRIATPGADGVMGPDMLPYPIVRWLRRDAPPETGVITLPIMIDPRKGISAPAPDLGPDMTIRFTGEVGESSATAAGGALLSERYDGHFAGAVRPVPVTMDVTRPMREITFARPFRVAGFPVQALLVRIADFRGDNALPQEHRDDADIVVSPRDRPQGAEPWITLGRDRLDRCEEIRWDTKPRRLTLRCAFEP